jgi:hypothetical protein
MPTGGTGCKKASRNHSNEVSYIRDMNDDVFRSTWWRAPRSDGQSLFHIMAKGFAIATAFNKGNTLV